MDPSPTDVLADLERVTVRLGGVPILVDVELRIRAGETLGVVGPNGSGKTTLLRVLATLLRPTAGSGRVLGARLGSPEVVAVRPRIGLAGHVPALWPDLTLQENLEIVARLTGRPPAVAAGALDAVGLAGAGDRLARRVSFGMQRRTELARMRIVDPVLLLLDEPHVGLDHAAVPLVEAFIRRVTARGGAAVLVSHDHERLLPLVDRVGRLEAGRWVPVDRSSMAHDVAGRDGPGA